MPGKNPKNKIKENNTYITLPLKGGQPLLVSKNAMIEKQKKTANKVEHFRVLRVSQCV